MSSQSRKYELKARAESQAQTRGRIVEATSELHEEVGPALTTVAEIARRAGVSRLTVYNHFPGEGELIGACSAHYLAEHPPPDLEPIFALEDPGKRLEAALRAFYSQYRQTERMTSKVQRDRDAVPALDAILKEAVDAPLEQLTQALAAGLGTGRKGQLRVAAMIRLGLDFATWRRLTLMGLDDGEAAVVMAGAVAAVGGDPVTNSGRRTAAGPG